MHVVSRSTCVSPVNVAELMKGLASLPQMCALGLLSLQGAGTANE